MHEQVCIKGRLISIRVPTNSVMILQLCKGLSLLHEDCPVSWKYSTRYLRPNLFVTTWSKLKWISHSWIILQIW